MSNRIRPGLFLTTFAVLCLAGLFIVRHIPGPMAALKEVTADVVSRFVQDVQEVQRGMMTLFSKFIREPLRAMFILGLAFTLDALADDNLIETNFQCRPQVHVQSMELAEADQKRAERERARSEEH